MNVIHRDKAAADLRACTMMRWICILLTVFAIAGCVRSEDAVDADDLNNVPVNGENPAPGTPPGDTPVDNPPPVDEPPPEDEMPPPVDPDPPVDEPELTDVQVFEQTLFPVLRDPNNFCAGCHGSVQVPLFAVAEVMDAYNALVSQQKVDLQNPANSRIYLRAAEDRHNCGGADSCDLIAAALLAAINDWAAQAEPAEPPAAAMAVSGTTSFAEAVELEAPRADENVIAKFLFDEGAGDTAMDSSGVGAAITLQLTGTEWVDGGGLRNVSGKAQASAADSSKLFDMIDATRAFTVEAWVIPENTAQDGPARIVSYSQDTSVRNFTMGQNAIYYQLRNRSAGTSANGSPALEALDPEVATALQHVVMTFDEASGRKVFINGQLSIEENTADTLDWQANQLLVLGNETTDDRLWQGVFRLVAIHSQALTPAQVAQNFDAGVGNLTTLRFDVAELVGAPAVIEMVASELGGGGYMFAKPRYIGDTVNLPVKNIRIAVNDTVPVAAQSFRRVDRMIEQNGTELSPLGAVIPASLGAQLDQFQLVFEVFGNAQGSAEGVAPATPPPALPDVLEPDYGVRSFSQINDTMAELTGIDQNGNGIRNLYAELRGSLPASTDLLSYGQSQQVAIQRLANGYCDAIVSNNGRCNAFFGSCQIDNAAGKGAVADTLFQRFIGADLAVQPMAAGVSAEVVAMLDSLNCANGCNGDTGRIALSASCAAVLSSGAVTIQ